MYTVTNTNLLYENIINTLNVYAYPNFIDTPLTITAI